MASTAKLELLLKSRMLTLAPGRKTLCSSDSARGMLATCALKKAHLGTITQAPSKYLSEWLLEGSTGSYRVQIMK